MAKSRRRERTSESLRRILSLCCSFTCVILEVFLILFYFFHPFIELFCGTVLTQYASPNALFIITLLYISYIIYRNRTQLMRRAFVLTCILTVLQAAFAFVILVVYIMKVDHNLATLESEKPNLKEPSAHALLIKKIQKEFKCYFFEPFKKEHGPQHLETPTDYTIKDEEKTTLPTIPTTLPLPEFQRCVSVIKRHARSIAVHLATIYILKTVLMASLALIILFYYLGFIPA